MIQSKAENLLERFNCNPPVTDAEIDIFQLRSGLQLTNGYIDFLKAANGGEGFIGKHSYLILWKLEQIRDFNVAYEVHEYAPGLLLIGSDGGGEAFAFDTSVSPWPVVQIPFVGMDREWFRVIAPNFISFLGVLYHSE
jgi:hypothetical protein